MLNWVFFAHGGVGPMQGQSNHFFRYAPLKIPYGIKRYSEETRRLYSVLEDGLSAGDGWLVGGRYSVADINVYPWVRAHTWAGVDVDEFPRLAQWLKDIAARPAVEAGLKVPTSPRNLEGTEQTVYDEIKEWVGKADAEIEAAKESKEAQESNKNKGLNDDKKRKIQ